MSKKMKFTLPYTLGRKLIHKQRLDGYEDKSLEEYFSWLLKDVHFGTSTSQETVKEFLGMWMRNFSNNLPYIRFGDSLELVKHKYERNNLKDIAEPKYPDFSHPPKSSAVVVGRGPSVFLHKHLDVLAEAIDNGYGGVICCTDGMLVEALKKGIVPDITTCVDGALEIKKFFDHPLIRDYGPKIKVALNATVNHEVYLACREAQCKVYWFYAMQDDYRQTYSFTKLEGLMTMSEFNKKPLSSISCGGNTGFVAWVMASSLFKRAPVALIGIDFGYPKGCKLEKTTYFSHVERLPPQYRGPAVSKFFEDVHHPVFGTDAKIDRVFKSYRNTFLGAQKNIGAWYHYYGGTCNCTEGGTLWGPTITCMAFKKFLEKYC